MANYQNIVIVCSGENYSISKLATFCKKADYIIACDGGFDICQKASISPDLVLGDMDSTSLSDSIGKSGCQVEYFNRDKDFTDSELALQKAFAYKPEHVYMFASTGSYTDHSILNILQLAKYGDKLQIITSNSQISFHDKSVVVQNCKNHRFGLFPVTQVENVELVGAKYNFNKKTLSQFDYSVSNVVNEDKLEVRFTKGSIILVIYDEDF